MPSCPAISTSLTVAVGSASSMSIVASGFSSTGIAAPPRTAEAGIVALITACASCEGVPLIRTIASLDPSGIPCGAAAVSPGGRFVNHAEQSAPASAGLNSS